MNSSNHISSCLPSGIRAVFIRSGHNVRYLFIGTPGPLAKRFRGLKVDEEKLAKGISIIDLMIDTELAKSRSDAKRKIRSGCVYITTIGVK